MRRNLSFGQTKFIAHTDEDEMRNAVPLQTPRIDFVDGHYVRIGNDVSYFPVWRTFPIWELPAKLRKRVRDHGRRIRAAKTFRRKAGPSKEDF